MIALVVAWFLTFTEPTRSAARVGSCPLGCHDTTTSADTLHFPIHRYRVWMQCKGEPAMRLGLTFYANPDSFAAHWPEQRVLGSLRWFKNVPAPATRIEMPDSLAPGCWYYVQPVNTRGVEGCIGRGLYR